MDVLMQGSGKKTPMDRRKEGSENSNPQSGNLFSALFKKNKDGQEEVSEIEEVEDSQELKNQEEYLDEIEREDVQNHPESSEESVFSQQSHSFITVSDHQKKRKGSNSSVDEYNYNFDR